MLFQVKEYCIIRDMVYGFYFPIFLRKFEENHGLFLATHFSIIIFSKENKNSNLFGW